MATSYYYRRDRIDHGPVAFRDLVLLVRSGQIGPDDFVCSDWADDWQPAGTIVGLFHMAGRDDVIAKWEAERRAEAERLAEMESLLDGLTFENNAGNAAAGDIVAPEPALSLSQLPNRSTDEAEDWKAERLRRQIQATADAAVASAEARDKARQPGWVRRTVSTVFSRSSFHVAVRWGFAFLVANLVAWGILSWSETELQRYPSRKMMQADLKIFPIWGTCSPNEFAFLLIDVMIASGAAAYGAMVTLERMADD